MVSQYYPSPLQFIVLGLGVPFNTVSLLLLPFCLFLCVNSSVSPQFFRKNWSINSSKVGVFMEEFLAILDQNLDSIFGHRISDSF